MARQTFPRMTSPRGVFIYPHLDEPDTKFIKPDGEYHTKLALLADDPQTIEFIDKLERILEKYIEDSDLTPAKKKKAGRADLYEEEMDDEGNETGRLVFKFKLKAVVKTASKSWSQAPRLFDAAAKPLGSDVQVWTGSEGKVNLEVFPYFMETTKNFGLSLRLKAAQILKLVSGGDGAGADAFGFGEEEGYVSTTTAEANGFDADAEADADEDDDEF